MKNELMKSSLLTVIDEASEWFAGIVSEGDMEKIVAGGEYIYGLCSALEKIVECEKGDGANG